MKTIAIAGTFDSKGKEYLFLKDIFESLGLSVFTIHAGAFEPQFVPDVSNREVAEAVGENIEEIALKKDRSLATDVMSRGMEKIIPKLYSEGKFDGIISFGGTGGTSIVTPAMRALPIGVPKVMVSTVASGDVSMYVGTSDIMMLPSIVDVSGINSISAKIFSNAAFAMAGMVQYTYDYEISDKPLVAATMFGVTTPCVNKAKEHLENNGYEVLVFHATGTGGKTMESLVKAGFIKGVLDLTTTELCDDLVGGILTAGPDRLEAAGDCNVPQVVSAGALDMVNFGPYDSVPAKFSGRNFYKHNPTTTLMRTTVEENRKLAETIARKLNNAKAPTALILPLKGVSMIDAEGQPFYGYEEDKVLFDTLRSNIDKEKVDLIEMDNNINDDEFALAAAEKLLELMKRS